MRSWGSLSLFCVSKTGCGALAPSIASLFPVGGEQEPTFPAFPFLCVSKRVRGREGGDTGGREDQKGMDWRRGGFGARKEGMGGMEGARI